MYSLDKMDKHEFYDEKLDDIGYNPNHFQPPCVEKNPCIFLHKATVVQMPSHVMEPVVEAVTSPTEVFDDGDARSGEAVEMPHAASFEHVSSKFLSFILLTAEIPFATTVWMKTNTCRK